MHRGDLRRPNLFVVGAPKAGTTSLHDHLGQHPEIFMSPLKETMHFSEEFRMENFEPSLRKLNERNADAMRKYFAEPVLAPRFAGIVESREDYLRLFEGARREKWVGEATPAYLWSRTAARKIAEFEPRAKIVMVLRNPVERQFSGYLQMWNSGGFTLSFEQYIQACLQHKSDGKIGMLYPGLESGFCADSLQRYWDVFPRDQVGAWLYEESRKPGFHASVFRFLGVDPEFQPDTRQRHLQQRVPRVRALEPLMQTMRSWAPSFARRALKPVVYQRRETIEVSVEARSLLVEYYREDVERLSGMLGRDLSGWLR
jgi:hypothetical protein